MVGIDEDQVELRRVGEGLEGGHAKIVTLGSSLNWVWTEV